MSLSSSLMACVIDYATSMLVTLLVRFGDSCTTADLIRPNVPRVAECVQS